MNRDLETEPLTKNAQLNASATNNTEELNNQLLARRKKFMKWSLIGVAILIILVLVIALPIALSKKNNGDDPQPVPPGPEPSPVDPPIPAQQNIYTVDKASLVNTTGSIGGVLRVGIPSSQAGPEALLLQQTELGGNEEITVNWQNQIPYNAVNNKVKYNVSFNFTMVDFETALFTLTPYNDVTPRFSIPYEQTDIGAGKPLGSYKLKNVGFNYNLDPFSFSFTNPADLQDVYVSTQNQSLVFMDKYVQMDLILPSTRIFGFGERVHEFGLGPGTYTMWASGKWNMYDDLTGRKGTYGVHPFILVQSGKSKDSFFGIFFRNANAQSPVIQFQQDGSTLLSYITTGGQLEVYFFMQGTAAKVIQSYQTMIGKPQLPPFWSLGWGQASMKYNNQSDIMQMIQAYQDNNFPLEVVYVNTNAWLNDTQDFTVNTTNFDDFPGLTNVLTTNNQKLVLSQSAGTSAKDTNNIYYQDGYNNNLFIKSSLHPYDSSNYGSNLVSKFSMNGAAQVFVDWFQGYAYSYLEKGLRDLYFNQNVNINGFTLEASEITTYYDGELTSITPQTTSEKRNLQATLNWFMSYSNTTSKQANDTFYLPFIVTGTYSQYSQNNWDRLALSLNATHPGLNNELEYNLHNLNGHMMAKTYWGFVNQLRKDARPFILARGTFAGTGKYASHWLGENVRTWQQLRLSIAGIMNMNMFGIPHTGADVCGYQGVAKLDEMCFRWIQLSTFYPLARSNMEAQSDSQEPYNLNDTYKDMARTTIYDRYTYLRFMYTCLFAVSRDGGVCVHPTFMTFPLDDTLYLDTERTFMVDGKVLVTPLVDPNPDVNGTYEVYFPQGQWASLVNAGEVIDNSAGGSNQNITAQARVNAYLKEGSIIPLQVNSDLSIKTTADLVKKPISLVVNRDTAQSATGSLFLDGGLSLSEIENKEYEYYNIGYQSKSIHFSLIDGSQGKQNHVLEKITILNALDLETTDFACSIGGSPYQRMVFNITFDKQTKTLEITPAQETKFNQINYIYLGSTANKEPNLCQRDIFQYKVNEPEVLLNSTSAMFTLSPKQAGALPNLQVNLRFVDQGIVNIQWTYQDSTGMKPHYKVPEYFVNTQASQGAITYDLSYFVKIEYDPFSISVRSRNAFETMPFFNISSLMYDQYMSIVKTTLQTMKGDNFQGIFGLGERQGKDFFFKDGVYTLWSKDQAITVEDGKQPTKSLYGVHPFYMFKHNTSSWVGVYTNMAQAQDWWVRNTPATGTIDLRTISTGAVSDIYVFLDQQTPDKILERYYTMIGKPAFIPQWALGWHQCKWGYITTQSLRDSVDGYRNNNIPLEVQWADIDYMDAEYDFTVDSQNFGDLQKFVNEELHGESRKFVPLLDAGIAYRPGSDYTAFNQGMDMDVFLSTGDAPNRKIFTGKVWPNAAVYPDFTKQNTSQWWWNQLNSMYSQFNFDGLWLDMNEPSNFCNGQCSGTPIVDSINKKLKYIPGGASLEEKTISLDIKDSEGNYFLDTHSLYGATETMVTSKWYTEVMMTRPFLIKRSSFAGSGKYGQKWLGDNYASQEFMGYSVSSMMLMNIFGIPFIGADICGFMGDTTPELCARWHNLASFYPFSRNHNNGFEFIAQEPYAFLGQYYEDGRAYTDIMRQAIQRKYSLVRYYYTQLYQMSTEATKTFIKPMFFVFPEDPNSFVNITNNVMIGDQLKLSINSDTLDQNTTTFYFPKGVWCNMLNTQEKCMNSTGESVELQTKAYDVYAHIKEGSIIPYQTISDADKINTTADLQKKPVEFHVVGAKVLDNGNWRAEGIYYNDDGYKLNLTDNGNYYQLVAEYKNLTNITGDYSKIYFKINQQIMANNYYDDTTKSFDINANDKISNIYFYNAGVYKTSDYYYADGIDANGKVTRLTGYLSYKEATDHLEYIDDVPLSLGTYEQIVFSH